MSKSGDISITVYMNMSETRKMMNTAAEQTNAGENTETKRARRTPEEARQARIEREQTQAEKNKARAERLKKQAADAEAKAQKALERQQAIEANEAPVREVKEIPVIKENVAQRVQRDLKKALKEIGEKHGIEFGELAPRLTERGAALSVRVVAHVAQAAGAVRKATGATREATAFINNAKLVGIKPTLLGKNVQLAGEEGSFKVLGLKGRKNDVLLELIGGDAGTKTVSVDEFKTKMVMA